MSDYIHENVSYSDARKRNLLIVIPKVLLNNEFRVNSKFSKEELSTIFYFRTSDLYYYIDEFFRKLDEDKYIIRDEIEKNINQILNKHTDALKNLESAKVLFNKGFGRFYLESEKSKSLRFQHNKFNTIFEAIKPIIPILHWGLLPILPEHLMTNSQKIPENNIIDFYYHYHMLTALLKEMEGRGVKMSMKGDINLNKPLTFTVYSRRWGHTDTYRMERTIDGWNVKNIAINGKCEKNGEGSFIMNLRQDHIFYPKEGVKYALENLWDLADENEMPVEELQEKLQQIADWISAVEKTVGKNQPEWVNYY